ncbi:hypothetical protein N0B31_00980 [Salinirubellus salinus]|uniref:HPt domain-containing protein n=1 Tax=Salinirubellus salinus TaxID=1364945 RepID=A0A9E7R3C4_9EURY|nr:hypothetical protein [Salinirubellus salinus]UWM54867.1 hypothetical protein N0B31_00980 [Salinirubellus salinus]
MDDSLAAFFDEYDDAVRDYEKGYADADATLERVTKAAEALREAADDDA